MPPAPSRPWITYGPNLVPGRTAICLRIISVCKDDSGLLTVRGSSWTRSNEALLRERSNTVAPKNVLLLTHIPIPGYTDHVTRTSPPLPSAMPSPNRGIADRAPLGKPRVQNSGEILRAKYL